MTTTTSNLFSKAKRSSEQSELINHLKQVMSDFMVSFLEEEKGDDEELSYDLLEKWQSDTVQQQLIGLAKFHFPKKPKVLKDPNAPKKPRTSYILFCKESREQIKTDFPELKGVDITRKLGSTWSGLAEDEKKPFIKKAEKDKKRYVKEMKTYIPLTTEQLKELYEQKEQEKLEKKNNKEKGKRAPTAYNMYVKEKRPEIKEAHPEMKNPDITRIVAQMWKTEADKTKWENLAKGGEGGEEKPKRISTKKKGRTDTPAARNISGMVLFSREERADLLKRQPDLTPEQIANRIRKLWNDLEDDEREAYEDRAREEV